MGVICINSNSCATIQMYHSERVLLCTLIGAGAGNVLQRLVNKGIRFIFNLPRDALINTRRRSLRWLTVERARKVVVGRLAYSAFAGSGPMFLANCDLRPPVTHYVVSMRASFFLPSTGLMHARHSFSVTILCI